ncbi:MAG: 16S rRNA (uracil(1498)-N(3))-methyltransferase [Snowella sp.]|nr:16S rRNA (uracil(1498)-N(3))-methyltransferase [Snowella sp.]
MVYRLVISPDQLNHPQIHLTPEQHHYLKRVLRLQDGDRFVVMDGCGQTWLAQLNQEQADIVNVLTESSELPLAVTLLIALPKGSGFEEILRPCTELGVSTIVPVISDRTLLKPSPQKWERWQRIVKEAAEQCERQLVPTVLEPLPFAEALIQFKEWGHTGYICVTRRASFPLMSYLSRPLPHNLVIATGPEGGWTDAEVESAIAAGLTPVSLGKRILRAITAPTVALSLVAAASETAETLPDSSFSAPLPLPC